LPGRGQSVVGAYSVQQQAASGNTCNPNDTSWSTPVVGPDGAAVAGTAPNNVSASPAGLYVFSGSGALSSAPATSDRGRCHDHDRCANRLRAGSTVAMRRGIDAAANRGLTLIELVVAITIVAIAATAVLGALSTITARGANTMVRQQAVAIAEAYLEEILLQPVAAPVGVPTPTLRANFNDVDEYNGLVDVGACDQYGNPLPGLSATRSVSRSCKHGIDRRKRGQCAAHRRLGDRSDRRTRELVGLPDEFLMRQTRRSAGMTLIELVIVITLSAICVTFMTMFVVTPINAYNAQTQRAQLVDAADTRCACCREICARRCRTACASRAANIVALELIETIDGARYRDNGPLTDPTQWLDFTTADTAFATTVPFSQVTLPFSSSSDYLAIYNVGVPGANAYALANVITPAGTTITIKAGSTPNAQLVTMTPGFQFGWGSPGKRVYLVSGPITYLCDMSIGVLTRYTGYAIGSTQLTSDSSLLAAGASAGRVSANVGSCAFTYAPGTPARGGMATLSLDAHEQFGVDDRANRAARAPSASGERAMTAGAWEAGALRHRDARAVSRSCRSCS
jgi:MSHA biogenesis protein MshO